MQSLARAPSVTPINLPAGFGRSVTLPLDDFFSTALNKVLASLSACPTFSLHRATFLVDNLHRRVRSRHAVYSLDITVVSDFQPCLERL